MAGVVVAVEESIAPFLANGGKVPKEKSPGVGAGRSGETGGSLILQALPLGAGVSNGQDELAGEFKLAQVLEAAAWGAGDGDEVAFFLEGEFLAVVEEKREGHLPVVVGLK